MNFKIYYYVLFACVLTILLFCWVVYSGVITVKRVNQPLTEKVLARSEQNEFSLEEINYNLKKILNSGIFKTKAKQQPRKVSAKKTTLKLKLEGIIAADKSTLSRAVIRSNRKKSIAYKIGDKIQGTNAKLNAVEGARVLIERAGVLESLELERKKLEKQSIKGQHSS